MMAINSHVFNESGALVSSGPLDHDDEGAPPAVPGMKVHKDGEIDDADQRPATYEEIADAAIKAGRPIPPKPGKPASRFKPATPAAKKAKPSLPQEGYVSDRRRCLELAVESRFGVTDPVRALAIAADFLAFLEGDDESS